MAKKLALIIIGPWPDSNKLIIFKLKVISSRSKFNMFALCSV